MKFDELLIRAKSGDEDAIVKILEMYQPLLTKESMVGGIFDEDLHQELCAVLLKCIRLFA